MRLCTVGLGYIGLPTSIMFAKHGVHVLGVDVNPIVVNLLNEGRIHIEEPGLQRELLEVINQRMFRASLNVVEADVFIIAVPTPNQQDQYKSCDLSYVLSAVKVILPYLQKGNVVIVESTIAPRSMEDFIQPIIEEKTGYLVGQDIFLVHCPERVLPGNILDELIYNNRIVGGITPACSEAGARVYRTFVQGEIIKTNAKTAEMSKLMENTFRDVNIALANEMTKICHELQIDALEVIQLANKHPRVNLHNPGPGVGGHCLAIDPYFIVSKAPTTSKLIHLSREINNSMPHYVVEKVNEIMKRCNGKVVTIFGLTYKGNVDDIRESPAIEIYHILKNQGSYDIRAYDPHIENEMVYGDIGQSVKGSDLILVLTDHSEFRNLKYELLGTMTTKIVFDTRNVVQNSHEDFTYLNYGNLPKFLLRQETALV
ncbi:nucleotide sugar dehydrogenase [Anaerobacillus alkaliphilus]|uniref:Nucleotide sugar dehydrogenase n=1 Tax=Anaerobacillus alkaliphilus TaxID=1548597 RepID=A0A4V1LGH4_9BACI|nr:nucleotide sugar dehydrogenase [Anaerobacillus alkaliphilus]RXJ01674.1 nucleotide sugar dehydrogenase [Anaerobacillus alkaliphilus]